MADAQYRVTNGRARRLAVQPGIRKISNDLAAAARANTPVRRSRVRSAASLKYGPLAGGWKVVQGNDPGTCWVVNDVFYGRFVEYGTRRMPANPFFGRVIADFRARYTR
jgi:HK97 gp10 family phage protein